MKEKIKEFYEKNKHDILVAVMMAATGVAFYCVGDTRGKISMLSQVLEENDIKVKI